MDIECKLIREGGTTVTLDKDVYHFSPRADGAHVAAVENEAHQDRFLSITEAYRLYRGKAAAAPTKAGAQAPTAAPTEAPTSPPAEFLLGSSEHPPGFEIHGVTYLLGDIVALAHTASGLDVAEWNELSDETRADMIDAELDKLNEQGPIPKSDSAKPQTDDELRASLVEHYKEKFGKAPHHNLGIEKLRAALAEG